MTDTPSNDRPTDKEARTLLRALLPTDRFLRRRVFLAALARMTSEDEK